MSQIPPIPLHLCLSKANTCAWYGKTLQTQGKWLLHDDENFWDRKLSLALSEVPLLRRPPQRVANGFKEDSHQHMVDTHMDWSVDGGAGNIFPLEPLCYGLVLAFIVVRKQLHQHMVDPG